MSLVFYDTETTGTDTFFDQILQFAAVRTDDELREIERFEIRCRLLPHVVPAPEAMKVNGTRVRNLVDSKLPSHYQMVRAVRAKLLSWSPSLFIGWNSIRFDEELLRQALYKTLHPPYLTNTNQNSRSDAMRIAQACSIHAPSCLQIHQKSPGQFSFTLRDTARENGFAHHRAHDAVADVDATLFLCRRVFDQAPSVWSAFMRFATKAAVSDFITNEPAFCVSTYHAGRAYSSLATAIQQRAKNKAEWIIYDLSVAPEELLPLSLRELSARISQADYPVRRLKSNGAPIIFPADEAPPDCRGSALDFSEIQRRSDVVRNNPAFIDKLVTAYESNQKDFPSSAHVEKQIYDKFFGKPDEGLMDAFHAGDWPTRMKLVERFEDERLRTLGRQLIHLERPDLLPPSVAKSHSLTIAKRLLGHGDDCPWLSLPRALEQLDLLRAAASGQELTMLNEHGDFIRERHQQALVHS